MSPNLLLQKFMALHHLITEKFCILNECVRKTVYEELFNANWLISLIDAKYIALKLKRDNERRIFIIQKSFLFSTKNILLFLSLFDFKAIY